MAREIRIPYPTGSADLYLRFFNASGQYRRGDSGVYEAFNASNIALYGADASCGTPYHVATEDGTTGAYFADLPDATARSYGVYRQAGVAPAQTDIEVAAGDIPDKTGYALSATGLDAIADPDDLTPATVPSTFTQKLRWLIQRFWKADKTAATITVKNEAGQAITTQAITSSGSNQTTGSPE